MAAKDTIRVLLFASEFNSAQIRLKDGSSCVGLNITETVSRSEFFHRLRDTKPDFVVAATDAVGASSFAAFLERVAEHAPELPVIALGGEGDDGQDAVKRLEEGAADYLPMSYMQRLPRVIQRLRRDSETSECVLQQQEEVQQAYTALLDNQKLMAIGRLAASIAHEINNPLESITNLLYLLRNEASLSQNAKSYVELAEKEMERVARISKQTLNFYRETQAPVQVRPADLLDEVLVLYARRIEEKRIEVVREYKVDATLLLYPGEIRQVFSNLVTNAIEASPKGGKLILRVSRSRRWSDEGIKGVRIAVADSGCGIPAEIRQRLGQLFYTTKGQRGTGLGLWVTKAIVKKYGGEIQLFSSTQPHRHGTCFSIFLPTNMRPQAVVSNGTSGGGSSTEFVARRRSPAMIAISGDQEFDGGVIRSRNRQQPRRSTLAAS